MLRLEPTVIFLTPSEVKDSDRRLRFRRYLNRERSHGGHGLTASSTTLQQSRYHQSYCASANTPEQPLPQLQPTTGSLPGTVDINTAVIIVSVEDGKTGSALDDEENQAGAQLFSTEGHAHRIPVPYSTGLALPLPFSATARTLSAASPSANLQQPQDLRGMEQIEASRNLRWVPVTPRRGSLAAFTLNGYDGSRGPPARGAAVGDAPDPRRLHVYDDSVTATVQPQTPRNLPEARHQSRLQGSYTAPGGRLLPQGIATPVSTRRRRRAGAASPAGLGTPGFVGLYGGMENSDELILYDAGIRRWAGRPLDSRDEHDSD